LIRRIVEDLDMDVNIVVKDTVREGDGLAMSSRNAYLTAEERLAAPVVYRSLCNARKVFERLLEDESIDSSILRETVESELRNEPLISKIQYVSVDSKATMRPLTEVTRSEGAIISLACKVGSVRLIDNIVL
jgi:pantoate--beta-alanine ligase